MNPKEALISNALKIRRHLNHSEILLLMLRIIFYLPDLNDLVDVVIWQKFDCYINQEDIKTKSKDWVKERNFLQGCFWLKLNKLGNIHIFKNIQTNCTILKRKKITAKISNISLLVQNAMRQQNRRKWEFLCYSHSPYDNSCDPKNPKELKDDLNISESLLKV